MSSTLRLWDPALLEGPEHPVVLETAPEEPFDRLAGIAAGLLSAPVALVTLVKGDRHFIEGLAGLDEPWSSLSELAFAFLLCREVVEKDEAVAVEDARSGDIVHGIPGLAAYAGVPLRSADDEVVGSFCVLDRQPREWTGKDLTCLQELAASAVTEIRARSATA